jgi:hypothetical protein
MTGRTHWECGVDDDTIELYALDRVAEPDPRLVAHFVRCERCMDRIADARIWAAAIKKALSARVT